MKKYIIKQGTIINEGKKTIQDIYIHNKRIEKIANSISIDGVEEINAEGLYIIPGVIDDQVHFREPGITHKANIHTESRAAVAGGTTSFMEMPNTKPETITQELIEEKYAIASQSSLANYSFFMGAANDNIDEVLKTNEKINTVCGIKIFMGSSTGNMLVDNESTLNKIFKESELLIATHCESENKIAENKAKLLESLPENMWQPLHHAIIRDEDACFQSSKFAIELAQKYNTRLHILHISTEKELALFDKQPLLKNKRITNEVCVHHLTFTADDYKTQGNLIKCNPSIKNSNNRDALWEALQDNTLDIIATDHAPHTWDEKNQPFHLSPSGVPLVQHSLLQMLEHSYDGKIELEKLVEKMCHAPAICFQIKNRGFIREGYFADLVFINPNQTYTVTKDNILYKCKWSPFENKTFHHTITHTFVNGHLAYHNGKIIDLQLGERLVFDR